MHCYAQNETNATLDSLSAEITNTIRGIDAQVLHIVTDKSIYFPGDIVRYRVFSLHSTSGKLNTKLPAVFVEMINQKNKIIEQVVLHNNPEDGNGQIYLKDTLGGGYYYLYAFSNNDKVFAQQPIYIFDGAHKGEARSITNNGELNEMPGVQFFPEGGNMITGASSVIGLKVSDAKGKPLSIKGIIKDSRDSTVALFNTNAEGLGKFEIEPYRIRKYKAIININSKNYSYSLPSFNAHAAQIFATSQNDGAQKLRILLEDSLFSNDYKTFLIAVSKDSICFASVGSGNYEITVPPDKMAPGIISFLLFDKQGKLLSERDIYKQQTLKVIAKMNKSEYNAREKISIDVSVTGKAGDPATASFCVAAVSDHFIKKEAENTNEVSDWNLSNVERTPEQADLLMISNNFYKNTIAATRGDIKNNDSIFNISGYVKNKNDEPIPGIQVSLFSKTGINYFKTDTTDVKGRFRFTPEGYADSTLFTLRSLQYSKKAGDMQFDLNNFSFPFFDTKKIPAKQFVFLNDSLSHWEDFFNISTSKNLLPAVNVNGISVANTDFDKSKRVSTFSKIISGRDIHEVANESVSNAVLANSSLKLVNGFLVFPGSIGLSGITASSEPEVLVDGVELQPSTDISSGSPVLNLLNSIGGRNIDFIEVLSGAQGSVYGVRGANGVILINTTNKYNTFSNNTEGYFAKSFYVKGYSYPRPFTSPDYSNKKQKADVQIDNRQLIYWNGNITTSADGKASFSFYANDIPGNYVITLRGITEQGAVINESFPFVIKAVK